MIKIVLPFLLIGKALKPLAKIKKKAWSAMGSAFKSIKSSVDPMKSFGKIMEILSVLMLPLTFLFTILAGIILKELMPYIGDLIKVIDDLGDRLGSTEEEGSLLNLWFDSFIERMTLYWELLKLVYYWLFEFNVRTWLLTEGLASLNMNIENIIKLIEMLAQGYKDLFDEMNDSFPTFLSDFRIFKNLIENFSFPSWDGDWDGDGGDDDDDFEWPWDPYLKSSSNTTSSTSNSINVNLSGAIVDNKAKLINDIVEAVIIRIG